MITGFEKYTSELTEYEKMHVLPIIIEILKSCKGKERAVYNHTMVREVKLRNYKTTEPRVRHMIHVIRVSGIVPFVVATSGGYYVATELSQLEDYHKSLSERIRHIEKIRDIIAYQMTFFGYPEGDHDDITPTIKDSLCKI